MITHVTQSDKDRLILSELLTKEIVRNEQPDSYKGIVVPKPWGSEWVFFEDSSIAAWFLSIDKGHSTSMHCHPNKRTVLIILSGIALGRTLHGSTILNPGKIVIYEPGTFHSTKAITKIELAEIESPNKKEDLIRYNDNYGREKMGYEDKKTMIDSYEYFCIEKDNPTFIQSHYSISIGNIIKAGEINVTSGKCKYPPNSCVLDIKDEIISEATILRFKFPSKGRLYEYRKCI